MLRKSAFIILLLSIVISSCTENSVETISIEKEPTPFEKATIEVTEFLSFANEIILDSSSIEPFITKYNLTKNENLYRSEDNYGPISVKRIFTCKEGIINNIHFDFYYGDSSSTLYNDKDSLYSLLSGTLGEGLITFESNSMKTYSWYSKQNILDFEMFNNGYTYTLRRTETATLPVLKEEELTPQFVLMKELLNNITEEKIALFNTNRENIQNLFKKDIKQKGNTLAFTEVYIDSVLLSASFFFEKEKLTGLYFDYMYSGANSVKIIEDARVTKSLISNLIGKPNEIATVAISTSFEWGKIPMKLEIYSDGFSIIMERGDV